MERSVRAIEENVKVQKNLTKGIFALAKMIYKSDDDSC